MQVSKIIKYINTIKYLSAEQIYYQCRYRVYKSKIKWVDKSPAQRRIKKFLTSWLDKIAYADEEFINFLNLNKKYKLPDLWKDESEDKLWQYNVHYFDCLNNPDVMENTKKNLINSWIESNQINSIGYDAYPTSLRIVNWCKWLVKEGKNSEKIKNALYSQCLYLAKNIEYHISGNHIFSNIKALIFSGLFFEGDESNRWFKKALRLLKREINRQILPNGGHYELSPMYHHIVLEDLLDILAFCKAYDRELGFSIEEIVIKMLNWSWSMSHPDGEISFFNDSCIGIAGTFKDLESYAIKCGIQYEKNLLIECDGYYSIKKKKYCLIFDAADMGSTSQPAHAHADSLSFELSVHGERLFVNLGTSTYHDQALRQKQRSTYSHNTLVVDSENSSQVWSKFRVANRARITARNRRVDSDCFFLEATHDGYHSPHKRKLVGNESNIIISDEICSSHEKNVEIFFYVHPSVQVEKKNKNITLTIGLARVELKSTYPMEVSDSRYYPSFNKEIPNKCISIKAQKVKHLKSNVEIQIAVS